MNLFILEIIKMKTLATKIYVPVKRSIDITGSFIGILLLSPLLLVVFIITFAFSNGDPIFKQKRTGKNKNTFVIFKFRSMKKGSPNVGAEHLSSEQQRSLVTPWGRFIRKTSIDELPQLFNILKGDMSFIGPRPGLTKEGEPELFASRSSYVPCAYDVKPGLSGYSQIMLKRSPDVDLRGRYDSYYVQHMSFLFDTKIFLLSFLTLFGFNKGK
jgi:lipopolysaccharide/colanic/teichoic acid biosynthesis glycosyltransferase